VKLSWLRPAYGEPSDGPYATVYLDATRADESGPSQVSLRWRSARERLADEGAPERLLDAMEDRALRSSGVAGPHGLLVVGHDDRVTFSRILESPPARESASWSALPHLLPLLRRETYVVPYALVVVDREGADITVVGPHHEEVESFSQEGSHDVIHKVPTGGWSAARYQRRAEDSWQRNAGEVATELDKVVLRHGLRLVLVAGDVRAVTALLEQVATRTREVAVELQTGGRAAGSSPDDLTDEVREVVTKTAEADLTRVVDDFAREQGRGEAAVEGLPGVVDALRRAQVEALLLHDDPSSTATLLVGADPSQLGTSSAELEALGVAQCRRDRADAALVRALVATDAELVLVPTGQPSMQDGIGALLRYADASTGG
jgi:hypothetical protein